MRNRILALASGLAIVLAVPLPGRAQGPASQTAAKARNSSVPRTRDGHPDLEGIWTNATITPMERPAALAGKATLTDAEARAAEKHAAEELQKLDGASDGPLLAAAGSSGTGGYNVLFIDRGSE